MIRGGQSAIIRAERPKLFMEEDIVSRIPRPVAIRRGPGPLFLLAALVLLGVGAVAQDLTPAMLEEAARRTGMSQEELLRRYQQQQGSAVVDTVAAPGRTDLEGIDDRTPAAPTGRGEASYWTERPDVVLPLADDDLTAAQAESALTLLDEDAATLDIFGRSFFRLDAGVFQPPSFGPVPADYLVGVGDQIVVDAWGEVEFRIERVVDRDGAVILPKGGKVVCHNRTLEAVTAAVRGKLAGSYAGIKDGSIQLDVSLGQLRSIRIFVIGDVERPGAYELSSVATVLTALYAAGGPGEAGSLRQVRVLRGDAQVGSLDLYRYLLDGDRSGDVILREGDTVLVPPRERTVLLQGAVRRPAFYELRAGETLTDLMGFGGGFEAQASTGIVHVERILPPAERRADLPDRTFIDIHLDPRTGTLLEPGTGDLLDGDVVSVDAIEDKLWGWVEIQGHVKTPGRYQFNEGLTVRELVQQAGGPWPDVLLEVALIDRTDREERHSTMSVPLGQVLRGEATDVPLQERDVLQVFAAGAMIDRETVTVSGEVRKPDTFEYRPGLTLQDVLLRAGGVPESGDLGHIEIQRLHEDRVFSMDAVPQDGEMVDTLVVDLSDGFLEPGGAVLLEPNDHVAVRRLPWYETQRLVQVRGEVFYNGVFALERTNERLSSVLERAGGLKPTAYARGARVATWPWIWRRRWPNRAGRRTSSWRRATACSCRRGSTR